MNSSRVEAFSDGVLAIIITIMVLQLEAPEEITLEALIPILPVFISYIISFIYVGSYWNNHHHMFQITEKINGKVLWANLHLLFWLSLIPFATSWIGENHVESTPVAFYGFILLMSSISFIILQNTIINNHSEDFTLRETTKKDKRTLLSLFLYTAGIIVSIFVPWLGILCYIIVLSLWVIPSKQIEQALH